MTRPQDNISEISDMARRFCLDVIGHLPAKHGDPVPAGTTTIVLLGPSGPGFWDHFRATPEYRDDMPDPLDRWSARVINVLATKLSGTAIFPFGGPPHAPFTTWAQRSGRVWASPVGLLVGTNSGLWVSFRGAIALKSNLPHPVTGPGPCNTCHAPCATACPVDALTPAGYDLDACHAYLGTNAGQDCMSNGCAARRTCPVSQAYDRHPAQSAHHMKAFHP